MKKSSPNIKDRELSLIFLSKLTTREILVAEQLDYLGEFRFRSFKIYKANQITLKRKLIMGKILGALIFGILPIIPLLTYFEVLNRIINDTSSIDIILFIGSLIFGIYFLLTLLNFLLISMLNISRIMSGQIFEWYRSLPISEEKLKKLLILTIIRSMDIPLIVITFSLPVMMLIGTQNLIIFFVCLSVSILNVLFCFSVIILFGKKMNQIMDINEIGHKKTQKARFINMISYLIIVIASIFFIQWAFTSLDTFFYLFEQFDYPIPLILILSMIPFPISPGYLISSFIVPSRIHLQIWFNILIGTGLFIILIWWIYSKSIKEITHSKFKMKNLRIAQKMVKDINSITIKIKKPIRAYLRKDLLIALRDLKTFLSIIMPVVLGFLFIFTYNLSILRGRTPLELDFIYNWAVILGFNIIISGMLIYSLFNIEDTGNAIISSIPLIPRDQAKEKLLLMSLIQIITVISPSFIYINSSKFFNSLQNALGVLLFALLFLFLMVELKIYMFGKSKYYYVVEEIRPEKMVVKWLLIFFTVFFIYFCILIFAFIIYLTQGVEILFISFSFILLIGFFINILIFTKMFPKITISQTKGLNYCPECSQRIPYKLLQSKYCTNCGFKLKD